MAVRFLIFIIVILFQQKCCKADDYFTSIGSLHKLWAVETTLIETIDTMISQVDDQIEVVSKFIVRTDEVNKKKDNKYCQTPLSVFKSLRRIHQDWADAESHFLMQNPFEESYNETMEQLDIQPSENDMKGASVGIMRLQNTYNLKIEDIAAGVLQGQQVSSIMTAEDCYMLGIYLNKAQKYSAASQWLLLAKNLLEKNDTQSKEYPSLRKEDLLHVLVQSLIASDNLKLAKRVNEKLRKVSEHSAVENDVLLEAQRKRVTDEELWKESEAKTIYTKVCNGETRQSATEQRPLHCRYMCNFEPKCIISPYKVEIHSVDPYVAVYHDVIYEPEMQLVRNVSLNILTRSTIGTADEGSIHDIRISQTAWLDFDQHDGLQNFQERLLEITGLTLEYAEDFQVVNYGVGGYYYPHYDFFETDNEDTLDISAMGNRILTALFYLNDVEMGGATAFPYLKIAIPPKKGSALVWYNLHKDLQPDYRTYHTGCPVLKGSKWIATQWFHQLGQEFNEPCDLEPDHESSIMYKTIVTDLDVLE